MLMDMILIVTPLYYYLRQQKMDYCKTDLGHAEERTFYLLASKCVGLKPWGSSEREGRAWATRVTRGGDHLT